MSDANAFLRTIRENPDDNTARLVYADWLQEQGRAERAEFIRVQVELERMLNDDPRWAELLRREAELFADHAADWAREELTEGIRARLADADDSWRPVAFRRGMPERVAATLWGFLEGGEGLAKLPPVEMNIEWLGRDQQHKQSPEGLPERVRQLAECPALANLTRLSVKFNRLGAEGLAALLGSEHLGALREFSVGPDQYGEPGADVIAHCERLSELRKLDVGACRINTAGLAALLASPFLRSVAEIKLSGCDLSDDAFARLARHEPMRRWRSLDLGYNDSNLRGVRELLTSPNLVGLESLDLGSQIPRPRTWLGDALAQEIVRVGLPPAVRRLRLGASHFTPPAIAELFASDRLAAVRELDLILNNIGAVGLEALARSPHMKELESLRLYHTELNDDAAVALAASPHVRPLRLDISNNTIGPKGMAALASSEVLSRVLNFSLDENPIGDEGAASLAAAPWLARLHRLNLAKCNISPVGVAALAKSPGIAGLVTLILRDNHIDNEGTIALAESPYVSRLRYLDVRTGRIGNAGALALACSPNLANLRTLSIPRDQLGDDVVASLRDRFGDGLSLT